MLRSICSSCRFLPLLFAVAACGGEPGRDASADAGSDDAAAALDPVVACQNVRPAPVALAVLDFIGTADPKPLRFLNAVSTDSALPAAAEAVVQDKGPTFYWMSDAKPQQQIRDKLSRDGDWATMLVVVRENTDRGDGTFLVRVGGHYIGAPNEGLESPEKRYTIGCQVDSTATWAITNVAGGGTP